MICAICLEPIQSNKCETICNHEFHSSCIFKWIKTQSNCPSCRTQIVPPPSKQNEQETTRSNTHPTVRTVRRQINRRERNLQTRQRESTISSIHRLMRKCILYISRIYTRVPLNPPSPRPPSSLPPPSPPAPPPSPPPPASH